MCHQVILCLLPGHWWKQSRTRIPLCNLLLWSSGSYGSALANKAVAPVLDIPLAVIYTALSTCCKVVKSSFILKVLLLAFAFYWKRPDRQKLISLGHGLFTVAWIDRHVSGLLKSPHVSLTGGWVGNGQAKAAHQTCQNITTHLAEGTEFKRCVSELDC